MTLRYLLALMGLGLLVLACRHPTDPVAPYPPSHDWVAPPAPPTVAAPPLPVTDVASLTSLTPPILTVPNCRIVKEVNKEAFDAPATNPDPDPEIIVIDGQRIKVSHLDTKYYTYDKQGRISRMTYGGAANAAIYKSFRYEKGVMYTEETNNRTGVGLVLQRDTILLNEQGYQRYDRNLVRSYERLYDAEGYFIGYKDEGRQRVLVENRNKVKSWDYSLSGAIELTYTYLYDLTRPGLPNKFQYLGKNYPSVNLKTNLLFTNQSYNAYRYGLLRTTSYYYKYDLQGRIIAEIAYNKNEPGTGYYLGVRLGITYYEYECP